MVSKLRLVFTITIVFLCFYGSAQSTYWVQESSKKEVGVSFAKQFDVKKGKVFSFEESLFKKELQRVSFAKGSSSVVYFPNEMGEMIPFQVSEAPVLSPELSAKYPQIKSYVGYALNDSKNKVRFSVSQNGVQSMMIDPEKAGTIFMQKNVDGKYVVYQRDADNAVTMDLFCSTKMTEVESSTAKTKKQPVTGQVLRRFRLAVSASGEYTEFHGGTVADALAAINATVTRVTEVYETDLGITFELIANTDSVIFTDAETDPYSGSLSSKVQNTLTNSIGEANYDLGILFHRIQNGVDGNSGSLGAVCRDNRKGSAYAATPNPVGDIFDLDLVSHEMGHQFNARHTWSHEAEGSGAQVEPGSGTTIMGYAGITGVNDVALNGDDYFHYVSIVQIADFLRTINCAEEISLTNNPPVVTPVGSFTIPKSTPFVLTGSAVDADGVDVLTYTWEQIDDGIVTSATFGPTNLGGANFRSQKPSTSPERYFPKLSRVIEGTLTQTNPTIGTAWETLSDVEREMNFAMTVRDNSIGGGQVAADLVNVFVTNSAGPFVVTSQALASVTTAGSMETITWNVADTDKAPINAQKVDILLSIDGGLTFPITLADDVSNNGTHTVLLPGDETTEARIMVKASDNIFFAVNATDFTIEPSEIVLNFSELEYEVCQNDMLIVPFTYETYLGFNEEVTFSVVAPPAGLDISFSPTMAMDSNTPVQITFDDTENLPVGNYPIRVLATSLSQTQEVIIDLTIFDVSFTDVVLVAPTDGLVDVSTKTTLEWQVDDQATSYDLEIATDMAFTNIIESANVISNSYDPVDLVNETTYFWRVKNKNNCGEGSFSVPFTFTTIEFNCTTKDASGFPRAISATGTPTLISKIAFFEDLSVADLNVSLSLDHTFLADLTVTLTSPSGTVVTLLTNSCGDEDNVDAVFDDSASSFVCSGSSPTISGVVKPLGALNVFNGESILGEWTLTIRDGAPSDGGSLKGFSLEVCTEGEFRPDEDKDGVFDDGPDLCLGTPAGTTVDTSGCPVYFFPNDNFAVSIQSESCSNNNDGVINIESDLQLDYSITLVGNGSDLNDTFTNVYTASGLMSGTYTICITGNDGSIDYEEHCFEVVVAEPEPLSVSSKVDLDGTVLELELDGSSLYNIELNGILVQTENSKISLGLKDGGNTLKVSTNLPCQGIYEEQFFVSSNPVVYPNPFVDLVKISFGAEVETVKINIFSADGRLVQASAHRVSGAEMELDLSRLSVGLYYLKIDSEKVKSTFKLVKQ